MTKKRKDFTKQPNYSINPTQGSIQNNLPDEKNTVNETNKFPNADVPSSEGEQSVSGDMPSPSSDDDTLSNAQAVGTQLDEDPEHPKEVDIGRDIDKAEKYQHTH